ncbi:MAG: flagellar assembly protein FliW [Muricomes sp.]
MKEEISSSMFMEEELIHFQEGLFGFEEYETFLPLPVEENSDAVLCLQSTDNTDLSFIIMNPFYLKDDYHPELSSSDYRKLGTEDMNLISFYVICVIGPQSEMSTVNLKCPIAVNTENRQAVQVILESEEYRMRHALSEFQRKGD